MDHPNGPSKEEAEHVVGIIEGYRADLRAEKSLYMNRCKPIHEAIKDTITEAVKEKGFDKKALKVTIEQRALLKKMEGLEDELDEVTQTDVDRLQAQLGTFADSPLGRAALDAVKEAAPKRRRRRDPIGELLGDVTAGGEPIIEAD